MNKVENNHEAIKKEKIISCRFNDKWLNPISKKFIYYHEIITDNGTILNIGTMEKNSLRIKVGATIEYITDEKGKTKIISSSNDTSKIAERVLQEKEKSKNTEDKSARIKGQEAFLGYAWSYAKDLLIAGKTMEDMQELNKMARFIYDEIGNILSSEKNN